jgi:hypothetical protein
MENRIEAGTRYPALYLLGYQANLRLNTLGVAGPHHFHAIPALGVIIDAVLAPTLTLKGL